MSPVLRVELSLTPQYVCLIHMQEACGLFALLRETESGKTESPRPLDISPECCTLLEKLMLTQAQVRSRGVGFGD